jgi:transcriptional regulator with XRE-family HTH domain
LLINDWSHQIIALCQFAYIHFAIIFEHHYNSCDRSQLSFIDFSVITQNRIGIMTNSHRLTLRDIAKRAGVSYQTVSRVVNESPYVAKKTRARVLKAIAELGYRPNLAARRLATRRSSVIGMVGLLELAHHHEAAKKKEPLIDRPFFEELLLSLLFESDYPKRLFQQMAEATGTATPIRRAQAQHGREALGHPRSQRVVRAGSGPAQSGKHPARPGTVAARGGPGLPFRRGAPVSWDHLQHAGSERRIE